MTTKELKELCKRTGLDYNQLVKKNKKTPKQSNVGKCEESFDSIGEKNYYYFHIKPMINSGKIVKCELHREFIILESIPEYNLKQKVFKPDFILYFADGTVSVHETKGKIVKKLQRDYQLRKHLFIEKYCIPNNWTYEEIASEDWSGI